MGYWAADEQYSPNQLLQFSLAAEKAGFQSVVTSDHFHPWFNTNAQAGFAWAWMATTAALTKKIKLGTGVTAADRYHPALIAQAFATLGSLFPGRFSLGLGTGEAMNSVPLGIPFPAPGQSVSRLRDALEIITRLWGGNFEEYNGLFYQLHRAKLYTLPREKIPIYVAAGGRQTSELAGEFGDGIIRSDPEKADEIMKVVEDSAMKHGRDAKNFVKMIEFKCSYDTEYEKALNATKIWRSTMSRGIMTSDESDPRKLEERGTKEVSDKQIEEEWKIVTNVEELIKPVQELIHVGFNRIQVHSSSPDELAFVKVFAERALPHLRESKTVE